MDKAFTYIADNGGIDTEISHPNTGTVCSKNYKNVPRSGSHNLNDRGLIKRLTHTDDYLSLYRCNGGKNRKNSHEQA